MSNFEKSRLTAADRAALARLHHRRRAVDGFLQTCNVIHHKRACVACGFPTIDEGSAYEMCVVCLWEDCGLDDKRETLQCPPNYVSLVAWRADIGAQVDALLQTHVMACSMDEMVRCIKRFEQRLRDGTAVMDTESFADNLKAILPMRLRAAGTPR